MRSLLLLIVGVFVLLFTAPLYAQDTTPAPSVVDAPSTANSTTTVAPYHDNMTTVAPVNQTEKPSATNPINSSSPPGNDTVNPSNNPPNNSTNNPPNNSTNNSPNNSTNNPPNNSTNNSPNNSTNNPPNNSTNNPPNNSTNNPPNNSTNNPPNNSTNSSTNSSTDAANNSTNNPPNSLISNSTTVQPTVTNNTGSSAAQMTTTLPVTPTAQVSPECLNGYLQCWSETNLQCETPANSTCFAKCSEAEKKKLTDLSCYLSGVVKKADNSSCLSRVVKCLASSPSLVNSKQSFCSAEKLPEIKSCFTKTDNSSDRQCSQEEYNQIYSSIGCNRSRVVEACIFLIFLAVLVAKVFPED